GAGSAPKCLLPRIKALPQAGVLDPNFVPCLGAFAGFIDPVTGLPTTDTSKVANYTCSATGPGVLPSQFIFGLVDPRHYVAPNTQQWNLTVQRALGKQGVVEAR